MRPLAKDTGMLGMALFSPDSLDQRKSESMEEEDGELKGYIWDQTACVTLGHYSLQAFLRGPDNMVFVFYAERKD